MQHTLMILLLSLITNTHPEIRERLPEDPTCPILRAQGE